MSLTKRRRFILVQSTSNANVTEDNMEPYHISVFHRRSSSMPSSSSKRIHSYQPEQDEISTSKFSKLNIHAMKKKSARFTMRLSSVFGLSSHTIDEQFNYHEQRFRAIEKFLKLFIRNLYTCIEALRESFITQVDIAENFEELLSDKLPDLPQQFVRLKRLSLENIFFTEFCNRIELNVLQPINTLIKLFISPSNLITKRHNKLLDYDSAQSAFEKVKHHQMRQARQILEQSRETYEILNSRLIEELPMLYEYSSQIISICLKEFLYTHFYLMQQMRINIEVILNQVISPNTIQQLTWQQIVNRFIEKNSLTAEKFFQLTITAKNFSERLKSLSTTVRSNLYNSDKEIYIQTDDIRSLIINRYLEKDLFTVIQDYVNRASNSKSDFIVRSGDLIGIINQRDDDNTDQICFVDNGISRGYIPRSILIPLISDDQLDNIVSPPPPPPIRHDIPPFPRSDYDQPRNESEVDPEENQRIYVNQIECQSSTIEPIESHAYASIDFDNELNDQEDIYIALYDFNCPINGVLPLHVGERLKILRRLDDDGNEEWWYVEKINDTKDKGYVPANYIQSI